MYPGSSFILASNNSKRYVTETKSDFSLSIIKNYCNNYSFCETENLYGRFSPQQIQGLWEKEAMNPKQNIKYIKTMTLYYINI